MFTTELSRARGDPLRRFCATKLRLFRTGEIIFHSLVAVRISPFKDLLQFIRTSRRKAHFSNISVCLRVEFIFQSNYSFPDLQSIRIQLGHSLTYIITSRVLYSRRYIRNISRSVENIIECFTLTIVRLTVFCNSALDSVRKTFRRKRAISSQSDRVNLPLAREATLDECSSSDKSGCGITDDKPPPRPFSCKVEVIRCVPFYRLSAQTTRWLIIFSPIYRCSKVLFRSRVRSKRYVQKLLNEPDTKKTTWRPLTSTLHKELNKKTDRVLLTYARSWS